MHVVDEHDECVFVCLLLGFSLPSRTELRTADFNSEQRMMNSGCT